MLTKKYYDGFNVIGILFKNLEPRKAWKVLEAFSECDGVDAVEVVRCKDCKWWNEGKQECMEWYDSPYAPADGYCFRAERKEE